MKRDGWIQVSAGVLLLVLLAASMGLTMQIASSSGRHRLVFMDRAEEGDPPEVALGIAMGAFRGIFVNFLWMRANDLKEDGKYYEAVDLAKTITKLQPRFPAVWVFHAWNLAYNISVATQTPQERYQWVQAGIRLLRDEGIPANPGDLAIHKELAWIHFHKIQGIMDDANWYYKRQFAREWTIALGPPPTRGREGTGTQSAIKLHVQWLQRIAEAHDTLDQVRAAHPGAEELVRRLRTEAGLDPGNFRPVESEQRGALAILERIEYARSRSRMTEALGISFDDAANLPPMERLLATRELAPGWEALIPFMRKRVLTDRFRMEPERMIRYTEKFGPLDWRHAAAHSVYWSARGVEESLLRINDRNRQDFDIHNTDRITIQSIQELYRSGHVIFDIINPELCLQLHNPDYIEVYAGILEELRARSRFDVSTRVYTLYSAGYENFLKDAIRFLYRRGDVAAAQEYHRRLREYPHLNDNDPFNLLRLSAPVDEFIENEILRDDRFGSPEVARSEVMGSLQSAFFAGLLAGNDRAFRGNVEYARAFHKVYTDKQVFTTSVNVGDQGRLEVMDREFDRFAGRLLGASVWSAGFPDGPIMYARAPVWLQRHAYEWLAQTPLKEELDTFAKADQGPPFDVWFRPPPGVRTAEQEKKEGEEAGVRMELK